MITTNKFNKLRAEINNSIMNKKFYKGEQVAIIAGPSIVVEMIIKKASLESGIEMDWHYAGGRGIVWSLGDKNKCREHLRSNLPTTDL